MLDEIEKSVYKDQEGHQGREEDEFTVRYENSTESEGVTRRELLNGSPTPGKEIATINERSEPSWKSSPNKEPEASSSAIGPYA